MLLFYATWWTLTLFSPVMLLSWLSSEELSPLHEMERYRLSRNDTKLQRAGLKRLSFKLSLNCDITLQ